MKIVRLAFISEPPNKGSLHPVPRYKVKCLRGRLSGWCRQLDPPSFLIQATELIYSCSHERAGAASLEAGSAAVLTELAPALMGRGGERGRDNDQTISDPNFGRVGRNDYWRFRFANLLGKSSCFCNDFCDGGARCGALINR